MGNSQKLRVPQFMDGGGPAWPHTERSRNFDRLWSVTFRAQGVTTTVAVFRAVSHSEKTSLAVHAGIPGAVMFLGVVV